MQASRDFDSHCNHVQMHLVHKNVHTEWNESVILILILAWIENHGCQRLTHLYCKKGKHGLLTRPIRGHISRSKNLKNPI